MITRFGAAGVNNKKKRLAMNLENKLFQKTNYSSILYFEVLFMIGLVIILWPVTTSLVQLLRFKTN